MFFLRFICSGLGACSWRQTSATSSEQMKHESKRQMRVRAAPHCTLDLRQADASGVHLATWCDDSPQSERTCVRLAAKLRI